MVKGYTRKEGVDYNATFAPCVRFNSLRCVLAMVAEKDMVLYHFGVTTAFLHTGIEEEIYMYNQGNFIAKEWADMVCQLKRSIYGLKQILRQWTKQIDRCVFNQHGVPKEQGRLRCLFRSRQ